MTSHGLGMGERKLSGKYAFGSSLAALKSIKERTGLSTKNR